MTLEKKLGLHIPIFTLRYANFLTFYQLPLCLLCCCVQVCKMQSVLKKYGVTKGSKVTLYLPMVMALPICMLACARMGAILNIVFAGVCHLES